MTDLTAWAAFTAGILSFLSPCVLPLVPAYISLMSGLSVGELSRADAKSAARKTGLGSVFFVLGFTVVFTAMGASATAAGRLIEAHIGVLTRVAGVLIVLFGIHFTGLLPIRRLYVEKRFSMSRFSPGLAGSFLMGLAFAFGWTPCIGPILAGILALAATRGTVGQGVFLLLLYSLGLGIPFILTGFGVNRFLSFFRRYRPFLRWGEIAAGILLIMVGVLVFTNKLAILASFMPGFLNKFVR